MPSGVAFDEIDEAEASMDQIYNQPDFRELRNLVYTIPGPAKPFSQSLISYLRCRSSDRVHLLDLGYSYGLNTALLKHDLSMSDLYEHQGNEARTKATSGQIVAGDQGFFGDLDEPETIEVIGLE